MTDDHLHLQRVRFAIECWESGEGPWLWYYALPEIDPSEYMSLLPEEMKSKLAAADFIQKPPATFDDFNYIESSNYSAAAFEGLTERQIDQKIEDDRRQRRRRRFDQIWLLHRYFTMGR